MGPPDHPPHAAKPARSWPDVLKVWGPVTLLGLAAFFIAWQFVEPAPPARIRLGTGASGGAYERMGQRYAAAFGANGIGVDLVATAGSVDNWSRLLNGEVDAAIVQSGTAPPDAADALEAVVSVAFEPLFVFYREDALNAADAAGAGTSLPVVDRIGALSGQRVSIGASGSGTRVLVGALLNEVGQSIDRAEPAFLDLDNPAAADALLAGRIDAACFVMSPEAPLIQRLLAAEGIGLIDFARAPAFAHRLPYLSAVKLDEGVVDPPQNLPRRDVNLVAPAAYLVVRKDTHRAVVQLLVEAAKDDRTTSMVAMPGDFPSLEFTDVPVADEAEFFFQRGPNFLHRTLPFALASLIDRLIILVIPLLAVLIPLLRAAPPALRWSVRRRIYRWYRQLRVIDAELSVADVPHARLDSDLDQLNRLDAEVAETDVPLSYMEEFYNLRLHIAYMRERVEQRLGLPTDDTPTPAPKS